MQKRNYGIDLFRIVSMFMIVFNHVLLMGGILSKTTELGVGTLKYDLVWFLDILCYGAVNCYALISGYVGVDSRFKLQNIVRLWAQVLSYSIGLNLAVWLLIPESSITKLDVIKMFFPISFQRYWYFSAYFILFFMMPFLNKMLHMLSKKELRKLLITLFVLFSICETLAFREKSFASLSSGYSWLWLAILYTFGGYIKLYGWSIWKKNLSIYFSMAILTYICLIILGGEQGHGRLLMNYPSPTIFIMAIALLNIFSKLDIKENIGRVITRLSTVTFGVYLIHLQPLVAQYCLTDRFSFATNYAPLKMLIYLLSIALCIYCISAVIEVVRAVLFESLKINYLINKISQKVQKYILSKV